MNTRQLPYQVLLLYFAWGHCLSALVWCPNHSFFLKCRNTGSDALPTHRGDLPQMVCCLFASIFCLYETFSHRSQFAAVSYFAIACSTTEVSLYRFLSLYRFGIFAKIIPSGVFLSSFFFLLFVFDGFVVEVIRLTGPQIWKVHTSVTWRNYEPRLAKITGPTAATCPIHLLCDLDTSKGKEQSTYAGQVPISHKNVSVTARNVSECAI